MRLMTCELIVDGYPSWHNPVLASKRVKYHGYHGLHGLEMALVTEACCARMHSDGAKEPEQNKMQLRHASCSSFFRFWPRFSRSGASRMFSSSPLGATGEISAASTSGFLAAILDRN